MRIIIYKCITHSLLLSLCIHVSCYTYSRGDFIGYTEIPNSQILQYYNYDHKITSPPTIYSPRLVLSFKKTPVYQYSATENYNEIRTPEKGANIVPDILKYGGTAAAMGGLIMFADSTASDVKKETAYWLIGGGISGCVIGYLISPDSDPKVTENKIKGNSVTKNRDGESTSLINKNINVKIEYNSKSYSTSSQGEITIDLVKDYGLASFENEKDIYVEFEFSINESNILNSKTASWSKKIKLKSSDWTTKHFVIEADEINVYDTPSTSGKKIGIGKKSEQYKVIDFQEHGWVKINYGGKIGWVPYVPFASGKYLWLYK